MDDLAQLRQRRADEWRASRAAEGAAETATPQEGSESEVPQVQSDAANGASRTEVANGQDGDEVPCCRICLDSEETAETGRLFSPCKCTGSMRFVHVNCLNAWRSRSENNSSYYKCNSCKYRYRLERLRFSTLLLKDRFHMMLTALCFLIGGSFLGLLCQYLAPSLPPLVMDRLDLPPSVSLFLMTGPIDQIKGNPACWDRDYTYNFCCSGGPPGNEECWDDQHDFNSCCKGPSETIVRLQAVLAPVLRLLFCGSMGLSAVGFSLYSWRQVQEALNGEGAWHVFMFAAWVWNMGDALARIVAVVGSAIAFRELYNVLRVQAKDVASRIGDRVLEVE
eukprot:TRINITY_DN2461_c1_g1_i1.p1 TRINITY_DN2461_c1_g1~~TRINITY_DN2461_c1_g1_i1.p1  ORF type:complete len:358 (+),score=59.90 TRINITY_DN2461_c1_g1_i1:69-1076(+)